MHTGRNHVTSCHTTSDKEEEIFDIQMSVCVYLCFLIFGLDRMSDCVVLIPLHVVEVLEAFLIGLETEQGISCWN